MKVPGSGYPEVLHSRAVWEASLFVLPRYPPIGLPGSPSLIVCNSASMMNPSVEAYCLHLNFNHLSLLIFLSGNLFHIISTFKPHQTSSCSATFLYLCSCLFFFLIKKKLNLLSSRLTPFFKSLGNTISFNFLTELVASSCILGVNFL